MRDQLTFAREAELPAPTRIGSGALFDNFMKTTIPAKEVELCDICHRDGYLMTCKACGGRYCLLCDAIITGCVHKLDVCRKCGDSEPVQAIAKKYVPQLVAVLKARDAELAQLSNDQAHA